MDYLLLNEVGTDFTQEHFDNISKPDIQNRPDFSADAQRATFLGNTNSNKDDDKAAQIARGFSGLAKGIVQATGIKADEYAARIAAAEQGKELRSGDIASLDRLKQDYERFTQGTKDSILQGTHQATPDIDTQVQSANSQGQERLTHLQEQKSVGGDYIAGSYNGKNYIVDKQGRVIVQFDKAQYINTSDDTQILVAHVPDRSDFSGATIPDTHVLLIGDKVVSTIKNPQEEVKAGYKPRESVTMVIGHELTHTKINTMQQEQRGEITTFVANNWGTIYEFASALLIREDYRKAIVTQSLQILAKYPDAKTRPVMVNGQTISVAVEAVMNELFAYNSANVILGEDRVRTLAAINPTNQINPREFLSARAGDAMTNLKKIHATVPGEHMYASLATDMTTVMSTLGNFIRS